MIGDADRRMYGRRWVGSALFETVRHLNGQCLNFLLQLSRTAEHSKQFACLRDHVPLWAEMDSEALVRAASCPVLLLDINFQSHEWWDASKSHIHQHAAGAIANPGFENAEPLMYDILTEAWTAVRSLPRAASLAFGMTPTVTAAIAGLRAADIHGLATAAIHEVRPRWESHPQFWKDLLTTARQKDTEAMTRMHLECLQLLGSGFVSDKALRPSPAITRDIK